MQTETSTQLIDENTLKKIFLKMQSADRIIAEAKKEFPSSFFFDIEQPHQIFAKAFNIDDIKMAETLVNLMRNDQSKLDEIKFRERINQLNQDQEKLYYDCYNEKDNFPLNCIEHLIKLWLKRNGVITFDPMAQKSYINNIIKQINIKPNPKMELESFRKLLKEPQLRKLLENQNFNKANIQPASSNQFNYRLLIPPLNKT